MKKLLPLLVLLAVLAGIIAFTWHRAGGLGEKFPATRAAELAPAEASLFLLLPDVDRALARWERSELCAMAEEHVWREKNAPDYLLRWREQNFGTLESAGVFGLLAETKTIAPSGFFLAITAWDSNDWPAMVGGFPYRGRKTEVESAIGRWKEQMLKHFPHAKSELSQHRAIEIETLSGLEFDLIPVLPSPFSPGNIASVRPAPTVPSLHLAFRDDWLFFATDRALLTGALDRYLGRVDTSPALAGVPGFAEARPHDLPEPDLMLWAPWNSFTRDLTTQWLPLGDSAWNRANPVPVLSYSFRLEGAVRERLYLPLARPAQERALSIRSFALAAPTVSGFALINFDALRAQQKWLLAELGLFENTRRLAKAGTALATDAWWEAFGPELSIQFFDPDHPGHFVVALEVRDATKARALVEGIAKIDPPYKVESEGGITTWDWWPPAQSGTCDVPLVLTKTHLLLGAPLASVIEVAQRASLPETLGPTPASNPAWAVALKNSPLPDGGLFYGSAGDIYRAYLHAPPVRPSILPVSPTIECITKHLHAGTARVHTAGTGWMIESDLSWIENYSLFHLLRERCQF